MPPRPSTQDDRFHDAARLIAHGQALHELAAHPEPAARQHAGTVIAPGARLGLLAGSFNPPTVAHQTLAQAGLADGGLDAVWYALSTRTVDKEVVSGACLEDRLLMLDILMAEDERLGVLLLNRGLYVDQARLVRAAFPSVGEIVFLVGFDKIVQIFDPRYYDDRDAALEHLFALATFLVAPRGGDEAPALSALLARPENRRFSAAVRPLPLASHLRDIASSSIRDVLSEGDAEVAAPTAIHEALPTSIARFVAATGVYADGERYSRRCARIREAIGAAPLTADDAARYREELRTT